jgi:hypothetical protein
MSTDKIERDPLTNDVIANGRRITYDDWCEEMKRPMWAPVPPSIRGHLAWGRLVERTRRNATED